MAGLDDGGLRGGDSFEVFGDYFNHEVGGLQQVVGLILLLSDQVEELALGEKDLELVALLAKAVVEVVVLGQLLLLGGVGLVHLLAGHGAWRLLRLVLVGGFNGPTIVLVVLLFVLLLGIFLICGSLTTSDGEGVLVLLSVDSHGYVSRRKIGHLTSDPGLLTY